MFSITPCNFWLIFKQFPTKNSAFFAACHIQNYRNGKILKANSQKHTFRETAYGLIRKMDIPQEIGEVWAWFCASYNDTKNSFYTKCHLLPVLWECITYISAKIFLISAAVGIKKVQVHPAVFVSHDLLTLEFISKV